MSIGRHVFLVVVLNLTLVATAAQAQTEFAESTRSTPVGIAIVDQDWPLKSRTLPWTAVPGLAVDKQDQVYVFTRSRPAVQVYDLDGELLRSWSTGDDSGSHCLRIDADGNVWGTNYRRHVVQKFSPAGKLLLTLGVTGESANDDRHFGAPTDIAFASNGDVFISDGYENRRVVHYDKQGKFVKAWGSEGTEPGQFALPHAIAIDARDRIYVADRNNGRVQVFNTDGKLLAVWDHGFMPWGLVVAKDGTIWACGSSRVKHPTEAGWMVAPPPDQWVLQYDADGRILTKVPLVHRPAVGSERQPGEVDWVHSIAFDSRGNLYLGDIEGKRAQRFSIRR